TSASPLAVTVQNLGTSPVTSFDLTIAFDGGAPITETVTTTIAPGATYTHTTTATFDLAAAGVHDVRATVSVPGDSFPSNDGVERVVRGLLRVTATSPYAESFDVDDGGWTGTGTWAHGTPSGAFISAAASGTGAWVTNPSGSYSNSEESAATSPCFDMSALTADPTLSFSHIYDTESCCDEGWIEVWTASS